MKGSPFVFCAGLMAVLVGAAVSRGDTLELTSGQRVSGTLTKYFNHAFEVRSVDGRTVSYPASNVRRISFDGASAAAKFTTRTNGLQEGAALSLENGSFSVRSAAGVKQFPLIFVERAEFVPSRGQGVETIAHGEQVDIKKHLALGNITVVDFYADWCGPCKQISPMLEELARTDPEIALRKVDIVDWTKPVAKQYNITSIPHVNVYGRKGSLIGEVSGADPDKVKRYVAQAKAAS